MVSSKAVWFLSPYEAIGGYGTRIETQEDMMLVIDIVCPTLNR